MTSLISLVIANPEKAITIAVCIACVCMLAYQQYLIVQEEKDGYR